MIARLLAEHMSLPLRVSSLRFEGGNIVADETFAYVGANTIAATAARPAPDARPVARRVGP